MASLAVRMPPAAFTPTWRPVWAAEVADGLEHHERDREGGGGGDLAGRGLDEVGAGQHGQPRRPADVVVGGQLAGLEDDLEVGVAAGRPGGDDLVVDVEVAAGQEGAAVDDHVDLVGAGLDGGPGVGQLDVERRPARGEGGGDRGDVDAGAGQRLDRHRHEVAVDADGGDRRARGVRRVGAAGLGAQGPHLAGRVLALQRGEVDHARSARSRANSLGGGLDRPGGEPRGPGLDADLVDPGQAVQEPAHRRGRGRDVGERGGGGRGHPFRLLPDVCPVS